MRSGRLAAGLAGPSPGTSRGGGFCPGSGFDWGQFLPGGGFCLGRVLPGGGFCLGSDFALGQFFAKQPHRKYGFTRQDGVRGAPMPEIGPWRTGGCAGCAQWGIGVRQFGGGAGGVAQGTSRGRPQGTSRGRPQGTSRGGGFCLRPVFARGWFFAWGGLSPRTVFRLGPDFALGQFFAKQAHRKYGFTRHSGVRCVPMPEIGPWRTEIGRAHV